jgi:Protein of unknown function (DUF2752)
MLNRIPSASPPRTALSALAPLGALAAAGSLVVLGVLRCPLALLFHVPCPMCGATRAVLALLALDPAAAMRLNPVAPFVVVFALGLAARGAYLHAAEGHTGRLLDGPGKLLARALGAAFAAAIVVWALRFLGLFGGPCPV